MPFFEPEPPPPDFTRQPAGPWTPPAWDRPSEGTLPAIYPVGEIIRQTDDAVVELEFLRVYPNGFSMSFSVHWNPQIPDDENGGPMMRFHRGRHGMPRMGVRFADGRTSSQGGGPSPWMQEVEKDADGIPTQPIIHQGGGGGSNREYQFSAWVFPLPPDGPLEIYTLLNPSDGEETMTVLDGTAIRAAAARARVIWS